MDDLGLHLPTDMEMQDIKNIMIEEIKFYQKKV